MSGICSLSLSMLDRFSIDLLAKNVCVKLI